MRSFPVPRKRYLSLEVKKMGKLPRAKKKKNDIFSLKIKR
jgi:hypothetical protein